MKNFPRNLLLKTAEKTGIDSFLDYVIMSIPRLIISAYNAGSKSSD